jgi:hypothetical protein
LKEDETIPCERGANIEIVRGQGIVITISRFCEKKSDVMPYHHFIDCFF